MKKILFLAFVLGLYVLPTSVSAQTPTSPDAAGTSVETPKPPKDKAKAKGSKAKNKSGQKAKKGNNGKHKGHEKGKHKGDKHGNHEGQAHEKGREGHDVDAAEGKSPKPAKPAKPNGDKRKTPKAETAPKN